MATYCTNCGAAQGGAWPRCPDGSSHIWEDPDEGERVDPDRAHLDQEELERSQIAIKAFVGFAIFFALILYLAFAFSW